MLSSWDPSNFGILMNIREPKVGNSYLDAKDRCLLVRHIDIGNLSGREIQGNLDGYRARIDYSCTLKTWEDIWRDIVPRVKPDQMKIG
jgi:hypothetical protein